ncbi:MAG: lipid A biosynthesis acyltransferase [Betaproteobacteria bacterium]|nr:lipid A biosynthesis acyltransferase [Betaproteobacteria bacterium]
MWLLHFLPLRFLARAGEWIGVLAYYIAYSRRRVCMINLAKCFPHLTDDERRVLTKAHCRLFGRFVLDHGLLWWAPTTRFLRHVTLEGREFLHGAPGECIIMLAPHFLGLDMGGARLAVERPLASMYQKQKNKVIDSQILAGRMRFLRMFPASKLFSRQDGVFAVARTIKQGVAFYYLPDLDFGSRDAIFVPFFGIPTATITGVSRLAKLTGAKVVPCITSMLPGGGGYRVKLLPPWENFPTADIEADTRRVNSFIEEQIRDMPEQYYWLHKRFKTRPPGEVSFY